MIIGLVVTILCVCGVVGVFTGGDTIIYIAAAAYVIMSIVGKLNGQLKGAVLPTLFIVAGAVYGVTSKTGVLYGACAGMCFEGAISGVIGYLALIPALVSLNRSKAPVLPLDFSLRDDEEKGTEPEDFQQQTIAFCKKCGADLTEGAPFCRKCGTKVEDEANDMQSV